MKIIDETIKKIILDEDDCIEVCSMKGNKRSVFITFRNGALMIADVPLESIDNLNEENNSIEAMKTYMKNNPKEK